nr:hypothetical protein [Bordetella bronchiseptica]
MHDRPAVLVEVEDSDGAVGWGEVWCNFPACGAEHRARLVETVLAPLLTARAFADPAQAFAHLEARTAVLAIQTGEPGPLAQGPSRGWTSRCATWPRGRAASRCGPGWAAAAIASACTPAASTPKTPRTSWRARRPKATAPSS